MHDPLPHRIEYSRNRHSRAFLQDDTIIIRLARNLTRSEQEKHIDSLLRRMTRYALRERSRTLIDPFRPLLDGESRLTVTTGWGNHTFTLTPAKRSKTERTADGWHIDIAPDVRRRSLHRFLWSLISENALDTLSDRVRTINDQTLRVHISTVRLRYAVTQWGSCARHGAISLNPALLFVPCDLLDYVIVHELAHRLHTNHSRAYWRTMESVMPDCQERRKRLRNFRICSL